MDMLTLEKIREQCGRLQDLRIEMQNVYNTYHSPSMDMLKTGSVKDTRSVTEKALERSENLRERYDRELLAYLELKEPVEEWLDDIQRPDIAAIVRYRFFLNYPWTEVHKIMGSSIRQGGPRTRLQRFLDGEKSRF